MLSDGVWVRVGEAAGVWDREGEMGLAAGVEGRWWADMEADLEWNRETGF